MLVRTSLLSIIVGAMTFVSPAMAHSPYENFMAAHKVRPVGLIATLPAGNAEKLAAHLGAKPDGLDAALKAKQIDNLQLFSRKINDETWVFVHFDYGGKDIERAGGDFDAAHAWCVELRKLLAPHPRATKQGDAWLRMELITLVAWSHPKPNKPRESFGVVTGLKPASERKYRELHQAVWPGVSDALARAGMFNWTTFLVETGPAESDDGLLMFTYYDYIGDNVDEDVKSIADSPVVQRWWTHTEPCLAPVHGGTEESNWATMKKLFELR